MAFDPAWLAGYAERTFHPAERGGGREGVAKVFFEFEAFDVGGVKEAMVFGISGGLKKAIIIPAANGFG